MEDLRTLRELCRQNLPYTGLPVWWLLTVMRILAFITTGECWTAFLRDWIMSRGSNMKTGCLTI